MFGCVGRTFFHDQSTRLNTIIYSDGHCIILTSVWWPLDCEHSSQSLTMI